MDIATRPDLIPLLAPPKTPAQNLTERIGNKEEARAAAEKFEAFFLRTVLEDMIPAPKKDAFGGGGNAEKIWNSMLHEQYAEMLAKRGGVGIADLVYRQLITLQEAPQADPAQADPTQADPIQADRTHQADPAQEAVAQETQQLSTTEEQER